MKNPELLLPAGSLEKMRAAYDFGADAVYAGQPRYSLRARNNEFRLEQLAQGDLEPVIALGPDALIMADPGLIMQVREKWPHVPIHLSVQANTTNWAAVRFWQSVGVARIILSRELSLKEVEQIRQACPGMELEVFVHGALCMAYSGRCLLSGYFNRRDPNQGTCTNACRWNYATHEADVDPNTGEALAQGARLADFSFASEQERAEKAANEAVHDGAMPSATGQQRHPKADKVYLIEEEGRPGQLMPIMEDEHGTYIMNSKDLRAVELVERLCRIGVDSLKIEGRTKSLYYVARTAQVYRRAIDDAVAGRPFNPALITELEGLANRGYTSGFLERHPIQSYQNYETGHSTSTRSQFVGEVRACADGWAEVETKNRFAVGDLIEIIHPAGNRTCRLAAMKNAEGQSLQVASGNPLRVWIPMDGPADGALIARVFEPQAA